MRVQLGTIYINRTKKYLVPCLSEYGDEFVSKIVNLFKLAIGIGDFALLDMGMNLEKHIFILIDTKLSKRNFISTINWLRLQDYYSLDYPFDDIHTGHLHMIIIKVPEKYHNALENFRKSKYSKMYSHEDLLRLFNNKKQELKVFKKDKAYLVEFVRMVNERYNTFVQPDSWEGELDFPIRKEEENF